MRRSILALLFLLWAMSGTLRAANVFNMPSGQKSLDFVTVGDAVGVEVFGLKDE